MLAAGVELLEDPLSDDLLDEPLSLPEPELEPGPELEPESDEPEPELDPESEEPELEPESEPFDDDELSPPDELDVVDEPRLSFL